ncbi:prohead maturation protease [uncultured archaeal virus]|uniref:Prohead maturation protease n=1 Tax=uncultured archaeal virus TaxID=1960247 RepID=A0ABM9HVG4_9VIRU|nr:prohead maturation protease [uncultured archaeal virus]CAI3523993.1 prohead maturation protease [uncultured archaeal virus]CAI4043374.1 prohead maturation protease [uncultured archaeal virus]
MVSEKPWSQFKESDYTDEQYRRACLYCEPDCDSTAKQCCKLPVREPDGTLNKNGVVAAWAALRGARGGVKGLSGTAAAILKNKIRKLYKEAGLEIPEEMKASQPPPMSPGAKGTIWKAGIHGVWVDNKPTRVFAPQYTIPETYELWNKAIEENGGITLGIDHIPEELKKQYPILVKLLEAGELDPHNVGRILEIQTDGEAIYATRSEHTNPLVAELHARGELPAFSVVAPFTASPCETGKADLVLDRFTGIKRTDYVNEGGCVDCKVGALPENMILTARLSTEDSNMTDGNTGTEGQEGNPDPAAGAAGEGEGNPEGNPGMQANPAGAGEDEGEGGGQEEKNKKEEFPGAARLAKVEKGLADIGKAFSEFMDSFQEKGIEASLPPEYKEKLDKIDNLEIEAKKAPIAFAVDKAIEAGKVLPVDREMMISAALADEKHDIEKFKTMLANRPVIVDINERSRGEGFGGEPEDVLDIDSFRKSRKSEGY